MYLVQLFACLHVGLYSVFPGETCWMLTSGAGKGWSTLAPVQDSRAFSTQEDLLTSLKPSTCLSVLLAQGPLVQHPAEPA